MLKERILTGAMLSVIIILVLLLSGFSWVITAASVLLSMLSALELCRASGCMESKPFVICSVAAAVLIPLFHMEQMAGICFSAAALGAGWLMLQVQRRKQLPKWTMFLVICLTASCWGMLPALRKQENGFFLLTMVVLIPVITDIGAFAFGKWFGKRKLAPVISPKKTWEGAVGGTISTLVLLSAAALILERFGLAAVRMPYLMGYLLTASCIAQFGDLTFSSIKRIAGIKDYGTLLPGHGGILDRFDSLMLVMPFTVFMNGYICPLL